MIFFFIMFVGVSLAWGLTSISKNSNENEVDMQNSNIAKEDESVSVEKVENNKNNVSSSKKEDNTVILNEAKQISLTDSKKVEINNKISGIPTQVMIMSKSSSSGFNNGEFTDQEMITMVTAWDYSGDGKLASNREYSDDSPGFKVDYTYIKEQIKKVFDRDVNINNTTYQLENGKVKSGASGFGAEIYKVKELVLNEKTNVYSLTFDNLNSTNMELAKSSVINYSNSDVRSTYTLQYKKNGNNYILVGLNKI